MSDTQLSTLVINKLTKEQYANIATPSNEELYFITNEDAYLSADQGSNNAGKVLTVGNDGIVSPQNIPSGTTDYNDLTNKPSINNVALSGDKTASDLGFANVAMTAEYSDLLNTPSIPSPQVNSDWNATSGIAEILNKPTLSTVATSGDYNDLTNKPTIPSNFANVAFTGDYNDLNNTPVLGTAAYANTSDFATAAQGTKADNAETHIGTMSNLTTMDKTSLVGAINEVAVGAAAGATAVQPGDLADVAFSGEYSDLLNTPTIPAAQVNADWNAVSGVAQILNKPTLANIATTGEYSDLVNAPVLSNVATTGDYNDLTNKPSIPTNLANVAFTGEYNDLYNKPTIPTVSDATIIITQGGVQKGSFTLNQASGDTIALDAGSGGSLPSQTGHSGEFLTTDGTYASWAPLANIATSGEYSDLVNAPSLANVATTGEYSDLLNTPTIPNVPVVVQDFYVNGTTGAINCTFSATPNTKSVHTIIGNTVINGTWSGNVFTPNTADDILNNANGFVVSVF